MKLVALNTIGLTGAEILAAELSRFSQVRMLPGQNFIQFKNSCYRPHDYAGKEAGEIFGMLSLHQYTRGGACWAGLTKSMGGELRARYSQEEHRRHFEAIVGPERSFLEVGQKYLEAFYRSVGDNLEGVRYGGWFGNNIAVNSSSYPGFFDKAVIINFSNPIDYWLSNVNQRFVWDNLQTIKFWIVNELFLKWHAQNNPNYLNVDIREYANDRDAVVAKVANFLEIDPKRSTALPADGFIRYSPELVARIEGAAKEMVSIYGGHALFKIASTLQDWAPGFLQQPNVPVLLARYRDFWNTTAHTNLDWVGPIEEEIVESALAFTGAKCERNRNIWFYHECFQLTCDHYETPRGTLEHYLGCLEDEITLPPFPTYARIVVCYLENVVGNILRRPYSNKPVRDTSLYRRLTAPEYARHFPRWAMVEKVAALEARIDEADEAIRRYYDFDQRGGPTVTQARVG